ncbi:MAG: hypothetical protein LBP96_04005, partial [Bacteroidales bacterium]|nr:hypothetical protein [Bacteroidales bacterium]
MWSKIKYGFCRNVVCRVSTGICLLIFTIGIQDGHAQSSVLSEGSWYRITVSENGIYRIRYEDLLSRGVLQNPV